MKKKVTYVTIEGSTRKQTLVKTQSKIAFKLNEEQVERIGNVFSIGRLLSVFEPKITENFFKIFNPTKEYTDVIEKKNSLQHGVNLEYKMRSDITNGLKTNKEIDLENLESKNRKLFCEFADAQKKFFDSDPKEFLITVKQKTE